VERVDEWPTDRHMLLYIIRGYVEGQPIEQRTLRTPNGWMASMCSRAQLKNESVWCEWKKNPFNKSWLEFDLISVEAR
jgi:hypothetical protein